MISELKDEEILDFLMTSDFEEEYKPSEFKYLLLKWRNFYRILYSRMDLNRINSEGDMRVIGELADGLKNQITELQKNVANRDNTIQSMKNRKLTFKERLSGKIIINENEN
jgi:hypothetical protein